MLNMQRDFGIIYNKEFINPYEGTIKFCGIVSNKFVFLHKHTNSTSEIIYIANTSVITEKNKHNNIVDLAKIDERTCYYFCAKPLSIIFEHDNIVQKLFITNEHEKFRPISINVYENCVIATLFPARMIVFKPSTLDIIYDYNLTTLNIEYPIYAEPYLDEYFLITDSKNNIIVMTDVDLRIKWQYGNPNETGIYSNQLFAPQRASIINNKLLISLRRAHCILLVNFDKQVEKVLGTPYYIGSAENKLWLPEAVYFSDCIYAVMCESSHIAIYKYNSTKEIWTSYYNECPIKYSDLCQPRSCDYSPYYNLLLVSDTDHNRIIAYDMAGIRKINIDTTIITDLIAPRCSIFVNKDIFTTSSKNRTIFQINIYGHIIEKYSFNNTIAPGEWLQALDFYDNTILVSFETSVILLNWSTKQIMWTSYENEIKLKDVHYSQIIQCNKYLISDNGNNRLVLYDNGHVEYISSIISYNKKIKLSAPRFAKIINKKLYIINSANGILLICEPDTKKLITSYGTTPGLDDNRMLLPRWMCLGPHNSIFISDTGNHRIIHRTIDV